MERQKAPQKAQALQNKTQTAQVCTAAPTTANELNERLADLMFDLQKDGTHDSTLQMATQQVKEAAKAMVQEKKMENPKLLGVLGRCAIEGCDVHTLTDSGDFIDHFTPDQALAENFEKARALLLQSSSSTIGILVYSDHLECLSLDGTTK